MAGREASKTFNMGLDLPSAGTAVHEILATEDGGLRSGKRQCSRQKDIGKGEAMVDNVSTKDQKTIPAKQMDKDMVNEEENEVNNVKATDEQEKYAALKILPNKSTAPRQNTRKPVSAIDPHWRGLIAYQLAMARLAALVVVDKNLDPITLAKMADGLANEVGKTSPPKKEASVTTMSPVGMDLLSPGSKVCRRGSSESFSDCCSCQNEPKLDNETGGGCGWRLEDVSLVIRGGEVLEEIYKASGRTAVLSFLFDANVAKESITECRSLGLGVQKIMMPHNNNSFGNFLPVYHTPHTWRIGFTTPHERVRAIQLLKLKISSEANPWIRQRLRHVAVGDYFPRESLSLARQYCAVGDRLKFEGKIAQYRVLDDKGRPRLEVKKEWSGPFRHRKVTQEDIQLVRMTGPARSRYH